MGEGRRVEIEMRMMVGEGRARGVETGMRMGVGGCQRDEEMAL